MTDADITDAEIAVMCDIARTSGIDLDAGKQAIVEHLKAIGLVELSCTERSGEGVAIKGLAVTRAGQRLLDARGVGVNES